MADPGPTVRGVSVDQFLAAADGPGLSAYLAGLTDADFDGLERDAYSALAHLTQERSRRNSALREALRAALAAPPPRSG